jgi:hypothetical protein
MVRRKQMGWIGALVAAAVLASACEEVTIAPAGGSDGASGDGEAVSDSGSGDVKGDGTAGGDATGGDATGGETTGGDATGSDATGGDASPGDAGTKPTVTGEGLFAFESAPGPANFRVPTLYMFQTTAPPSGHAYVLWLLAADGSLTHGAVLPYEDVPYKEDFTVKLQPPSDPKAEPIETTIGAVVTLETEVDAATATKPAGPEVYRGEHAKGAWVHIVHTLAAKTPGSTGYLQDADAIVGNVEQHRVKALAAFKGGDSKAARAHVEFAHNALVGKANGSDIDGDGKVAFDAPLASGLEAPETSLNHAVKHAVFAKEGDPNSPADGPLKTGVIALQAAAEQTSKACETAKKEMFAFAKGVSVDFKNADVAMQAVRTGMNSAIAAGRKLSNVKMAPK